MVTGHHPTMDPEATAKATAKAAAKATASSLLKAGTLRRLLALDDRSNAAYSKDENSASICIWRYTV